MVGTVATGPQTTIARSPQTLVNPRAALVWEPTEDQTYYFSYGKSAVPQGTSIVGSPTPITTANQALDPEKSETLEIGAKKSFFDGALGLSGSLFKVLKSNALITDPGQRHRHRPVGRERPGAGPGILRHRPDHRHSGTCWRPIPSWIPR